VDEILAGRRDGDLFTHLMDRFASLSGVSGVQPKVLIRDAGAYGNDSEAVTRTSFRGATHIVKFWGADHPELAANEFFCLRAAERCGLDVPRFRLAEDARALVIDRFDLKPDGRYRGFEDFCVLNARSTADKYRGTYETHVLKRLRQFVSPATASEDVERLFLLIVLNCALRNGDAHLKNFGVLYDEPDGPYRLAPVYDLVTTTAYVPSDGMALTLGGSTRWPDAGRLRRFGESRGVGGPAWVRSALERVADAVSDTVPELNAYAHAHPAFTTVAERMAAAWAEGIASLR
jgi:serine/threonine-protein kinase HipA